LLKLLVQQPAEAMATAEGQYLSSRRSFLQQTLRGKLAAYAAKLKELDRYRQLFETNQEAKEGLQRDLAVATAELSRVRSACEALQQETRRQQQLQHREPASSNLSELEQLHETVKKLGEIAEQQQVQHHLQAALKTELEMAEAKGPLLVCQQRQTD